MRAYWCILSKENAEVVAAMEDILDIYEFPYNPELPVMCMDEKSYQYLGEYGSCSHYVLETVPRLIMSISVRVPAAFLFLQNPCMDGVTVASRAEGQPLTMRRKSNIY